MFKPEDDLFHDNHGDPHWNEASWIPFMVPERRLCGWIYFFHRTTLGYTIGGVCAWDPSGEDVWNCRFHDWGIPYPTPPSAQMYNFDLPNGLKVRLIEPLKSYHFQFNSLGCSLDLRWDAVLPPHNTGFPSQTHEWGSHHLEQCGRMTGTLLLGDEKFQVDCWSNRDRSWGPRNVLVNPRGDFPWAIASQDHGFHLMMMTRLPVDQDPVDGVLDPIATGWYMKDGTIAHVSEGTRSVVRDGDGRPLTVQIDAVDELGRKLTAEGRCVTWLRWTGIPVFNNWSLTEWSFDGIQAWGEEQDFWPNQQWRQYIRKRRAAA